MGADVRHGAALQQGHLIGQHHGRGTVGHDQPRRLAEHPRKGLLDERLGVHVESRERVVEHEHLRPGQHGPGEREALALTARQRQTLLADAGVEAPGQLVHEPGLRELEGRHHLFGRGIRPTQRDVLVGAHREEGRLLEGRGHQGTQLAQVELADVDIVDGDAPARDVEEAGHERGERRLARPGRADQRKGLARRDVEVHVAQHELVGSVGKGEVDVLETQVPARLLDAPFARDDVGLGVEDLEHSRRGGHGLLGHREDDPE